MSDQPLRRHRAVVHGTKIERRYARSRVRGLREAAKEFNEAFDRHFCKSRPWLLHTPMDPLLKPKAKANA